MKNKFYVIALLLSLAMTTILTSCSNNDPDKLIGDWKLEKKYCSSDEYTPYLVGIQARTYPAIDTTYYYDDENYILRFTDDGRVFYKGKENGTYYATENYINFSKALYLGDYNGHLLGDIEYSLTINRLTLLEVHDDSGDRPYTMKYYLKKI